MGNRGTCDTGSSEYLFDELPFFQPSHEWPPAAAAAARGFVDENRHVELDVINDTVLPVSHSTHLLMGDNGEYQHGLHCRFGMRGVIAENHFDPTRNAIVLLGGSRRYESPMRWSGFWSSYGLLWLTHAIFLSMPFY